VFRGDGNFLKARQEAKKGELDEQLRQVNTRPTKFGYFQLGLKRNFFPHFAKIRNYVNFVKIYEISPNQQNS
jgi:hypothetical protein